ncbi:MAG: IS110 family transposase [Rhodanobacteraceae bacterium]
MNQITTIAIDLAKQVFQVAAENARGEEQWQQRLRSREAFISFIDSLQPPLTVGLEAGLGTQAWARELSARGLEVRVLPAQRVADHRSGPKNDANDARAILRALRDRSIHPVPIKSVEQLTLQALHRVRAGWIRRRSAVGNQMRGLLIEHGVVMAQGNAALVRGLNTVLADAGVPIPDRLRELLAQLWGEWEGLGERIDAMDGEFKTLARQHPDARRLLGIPGIGPMSATAMVCKGLDPERFANARQFAAYFGLVPKQHSSGSRQRLGRMSRHGDRYLCSLMINGAHALIRTTRADAHDAASRRIRRWQQRHGAKGAAVRLANHNLRVIWALLHQRTDYHREVPIAT